MPESETYQDPSIFHIIKDLREDASTLFRQEIALAKRELTVKAINFGKNSALIAVAAFLGIYALFFFLFALNNLLLAGLVAAGLSAGLSTILAPFLMGALIAGAALLIVLKSLKAMRKEKLVPEKTVQSFKEDKEWLKSKVTP